MSEMTAYQLATLVERVRAAQKRYFRERRAGRDAGATLELCRKLEFETDQAVARLLAAPTLFDRAGLNTSPPVAGGSGTE